MKKLAHDGSAIARFGIADDCLIVGGQPLTRLAQRIGRTPFYAIKANPMPAIVQHLATLVDGLDVASGMELKTALDTSMPPSRISFAGPGKSESELSSAIAAQVTINVESKHEMHTVARLGEVLGLEPRVALRVNPDFELKTSGMKMGGGPKPFGIDAELVPDLLRRFADMGLSFQGFHIFSGSQNLRAESIIEAQQNTFELAIRLADSAPGPVPVLNIGGGFGIPYFPGDGPLDVQRVGDRLAAMLPDVQRRLPGTQVVIELGRYIVGEAGIYVCKVIDRKVSRGQVFLVTDGGLHHHLAASGNFGQVIRKNYPVVVGNKVKGGSREHASVVGPLCTPLDILADKVELAAAQPGDLIVVFQSGAYGLTASPNAFLSHPPPVEVVV